MKLRGFGIVFLAAMSLVCATSLSATARAAAAPTRCFAFEITHDVYGDLVVPAHDWCDVRNITVHGNIIVGRNASIGLGSVHVDGNLTVATSGDASVGNGDIAGSVQLTHADNVFLDGTVEGDVIGTLWGPLLSPPIGPDDPALLMGGVVKGNLDVSAPLSAPHAEAELGQVTVDGNMRLSGFQLQAPGDYITVGGSLVLDRLQGPPAPNPPFSYQSFICGLTVAGNATIEYSAARMNWGGTNATCDYSPNAISGALLVHDNTGPIRLSASVGGDLVCRRNLHHPYALQTHNPALALTIGGHAIGQCAGLT